MNEPPRLSPVSGLSPVAHSRAHENAREPRTLPSRWGRTNPLTFEVPSAYHGANR